MNAHHDINTLIALSGGPTTFVSRLETIFKPGINTSGRSAAFNNTIFNPGNEPSFATPYLYNYVGRQDLTVKQSRNIAKTYYAPTPSGLPGNSDAGAMESWLLWNMLGLYPVIGQPIFLIGSPWFANTTIALGGGKTLSMTTVGGSDSSYYVQSLQVNGMPWNQSWLSWNDLFANGGTMSFVLGPDAANWTTGPPPPSPASEFTQTTNSTIIIDPKATMDPGPLAKENKFERRDIALGILGFAILAITGVVGAVWFWRKPKRGLVDSEKMGRERAKKKSINKLRSNDQAGSQ
jgi:putative alpha-1,2-mannosidase